MGRADEMGECGSDGKDIDGKDEVVIEDVMESHLSCLDSGSDAGCDGGSSCSGSGSCSGGADVEDPGASSNTDYVPRACPECQSHPSLLTQGWKYN